MAEPITGINMGTWGATSGTFRWRDAEGIRYHLHRERPQDLWHIRYPRGPEGSETFEIMLTNTEAQRMIDAAKDGGAEIEFHPIYAEDREPPCILEEAIRMVGGPRMEDYGHPAENFTCWSNLCKAAGFDLEPTELSKIMLLLKFSLMLHKYKRDNNVDLAGYAKLDAMLEEHFHG